MPALLRAGCRALHRFGATPAFRAVRATGSMPREFSNMTSCGGCGAAMQSTEPSGLGYCPPDVSRQGPRVCQRCYGLTHYGKDTISELTAEQYERELRQLRRMPGVAVHVVDMTDMASTLNPKKFQSIIGDHSSVLVANKADLLPKGMRVDRVEGVLRRMAERSKLSGLKSVHAVSAQTGMGIAGLLEVLTGLAEKHRPIFCVGMANVGKSLLLNKLACKAEEWPVSEQALASPVKRLYARHARVHASTGSTVSAVPGTTLQLISNQFSNGVTVFDTPGLLPDKESPFVHTSPIRPVTYLVDPGRSLSIAGMVTVTPVRGSALLTCFLPGATPLKLQQGGLLSHTLPQKKSFKLMGQEPVDLSLSGLGWVAVRANQSIGVQVKVEAPSDLRVVKREALMPFDSPEPQRFTGSVQLPSQQPKKRRNAKMRHRRRR